MTGNGIALSTIGVDVDKSKENMDLRRHVAQQGHGKFYYARAPPARGGYYSAPAVSRLYRLRDTTDPIARSC